MPGVSPRLSDTPALVGHPPHRPGEDAGRVLAMAGLVTGSTHWNVPGWYGRRPAAGVAVTPGPLASYV